MSKKWKIAFCGLGSIGSRHLRNLKWILDIRGDEYRIDWIQSQFREVPKEFEDVVSRVFTYKDDIDDDYDIIFITNSTYKHRETIERFQWHAKSLFIEKPIFANDFEKVDSINDECVFYVACPVRYKRVIQYIKEHVSKEDVLSAIAICSSYLPEWRKGTDYRQCYSAIKEKGGGVSLDLIHELDYLTYLFGDVKEINNIRAHVSDLEINSDDVSSYIAQLDKAIIQVHLDYFGKSDIRKLIIFTKEDTIEVDLLKNSIWYMKESKKICFDEIRDNFQKAELYYFLGIIEGTNVNTNDLYQASKLLRNTYGRK